MSMGAQREQLTPSKPHSLKMVKPPASVPTPCPHSARNQRAGNLGQSAEPGETRDFLTLALSFPVVHSCKPRDHRWLLPGGEVHELVASEFTFLLPLPPPPSPTSSSSTWTKATASEGFPGSGLLPSGPEIPGILRDVANAQLGPSSTGGLLSVGPGQDAGPTEPTQSVHILVGLRAEPGSQTHKKPDGCSAGEEHGACESVEEATILWTVEVGLGKIFLGK